MVDDLGLGSDGLSQRLDHCQTQAGPNTSSGCVCSRERIECPGTELSRETRPVVAHGGNRPIGLFGDRDCHLRRGVPDGVVEQVPDDPRHGLVVASNLAAQALNLDRNAGCLSLGPDCLDHAIDHFREIGGF